MVEVCLVTSSLYEKQYAERRAAGAALASGHHSKVCMAPVPRKVWCAALRVSACAIRDLTLVLAYIETQNYRSVKLPIYEWLFLPTWHESWHSMTLGQLV